MVAGGIGITPFLSILQEVEFVQSSGKKRIPSQIQLIYVVKKSQDTCLLESVLPSLLNQKSEQFHLKLKVFVTQEQSGATIRELLNEFSLVETVNFDTQCSNYATFGLERPLWMAAIVGLSSIVFLIVLCCFNNAFVHHIKKASKPKYPTSVIDLLLICSFSIAIMCGTFIAIVLRWRKLQKELQISSQKPVKEIKPSLLESSRALEEHEIHFGGRPKLQGNHFVHPFLHEFFLYLFATHHPHFVFKYMVFLSCGELCRRICTVSKRNRRFRCWSLCVWT